MLKRAPHSPMAGTGWLHGWRLTFGGEDIGWEGALATVVEDPDSKVFVVLYDMTPADENNLDRWEGWPLGVWRQAGVGQSLLPIWHMVVSQAAGLPSPKPSRPSPCDCKSLDSGPCG